MSGSLLTEMRDINRQIITSGGYESDITLESSTDPVVVVETTGTATFHHLSVDPQTNMEVNSKQIHVLVSIGALVDLGYPVFRDDKMPDDPDLLNDTVRFTDANGKARKLRVIDQRPDNTFGCILLFFEELE